MDRLLETVLARIVRCGALTVVGAGGTTMKFGDGSGTPVAIRFTSRAWQMAVLVDSELRLGEAYMHGGLVVEEGSIADFLELIVKNASRLRPTAWAQVLKSCRSLLRSSFHNNNLLQSRRNARHHYNIDYRLYRLFLDSDMQYSCAYFETDETSLEDAQFAKKQHIAAKLLLEPGQKILDIGSGWGGLGLHLARTAKVSVLGVNLSDEQVKISQLRASAEGLPCEFRLEDYRNVSERFDRIVSVGMFEHVGKRHYPTFFEKCRDLLTDDGIMVLHTIGRWNGPADTNPWVWRYIFPGGYTPAFSELAPVIEQSGLIISDIEVLRMHYAETLRHWRIRFLAQRDHVLKLFDEKFIRMWEYYLAGFETSFRHYGLVVFQLQLAKSIDAVPLTRDYMYDRAPVPMRQAHPVSLHLV